LNNTYAYDYGSKALALTIHLILTEMGEYSKYNINRRNSNISDIASRITQNKKKDQDKSEKRIEILKKYYLFKG
jgi:hypothetical protein